MKEFIKVMKALSHPNRVKILKMIQRRVMCVCEIQATLGLAQPSVSKHLKVLNGAGLVNHHRDGLWVYYHLADGRDTPYAAVLLANLRHWLEDEPEIVDLVEKLPTIRRDGSGKKKEVSYATEGIPQRNLPAGVQPEFSVGALHRVP